MVVILIWIYQAMCKILFNYQYNPSGPNLFIQIKIDLIGFDTIEIDLVYYFDVKVKQTFISIFLLENIYNLLVFMMISPKRISLVLPPR